MKVNRVLRQDYKTVSIPSLTVRMPANGGKTEREYAVLGGMLYVDGKPVQHYFSKDMFYYETEDEQGSIFLRHHGLMADVVIRRNGMTSIHKAGTQLCYQIRYQGEQKRENVIDAVFGMGIDESRKSYYYCGLKFNGEEIIPLPEDEESCKNQGILAISYEEKTRRLVTEWDTRAYAELKDDSGQYQYPDFRISNLHMVFDALYRTCEVTIQEGRNEVFSYESDNVVLDLEKTPKGTARGNCTILYRDTERENRLELYGIDSVEETAEDGKTKRVYYCGLKWNGSVQIGLPETEDGKRQQRFLSAFCWNDTWFLDIKGDNFTQCLGRAEKQDEGFAVKAINIAGTRASVAERKAEIKTYAAKGVLVVPDELAEKRRYFRLDHEQMKQLQNRCLAAGMNAEPLTLEGLCSITAPSVIVETMDEQGNKVEQCMDGQQYCSYKTSEVLTDLVNYYTGDVSNSDGTIKFQDIYGKTRAASLAGINSVSDRIIPEIEEAADPDNHKEKGYLADFLKRLSPVVLTNSLAKKTDSVIMSGYGGKDGEDKALRKARFYLSYIPEDEDGKNEEKNSDNDKEVLSKQPEYHQITAILDKYIYLSLIDKLKLYVNDEKTDYEGQRAGQTASQYWAERMYYHYVETLPMLHQQYEVDPAGVTHIIKMLGILDSESYDIKESLNGEVIKDKEGNVFHSSYALALYGQLTNYAIAQLIDRYKGAENFENYCSLLVELYGRFYDKVKNKEILIPTEIEDGIQEFLADTKETFVQWAIFQAQEITQFADTTGYTSSALMTYNPKNPGIGKLFSAMNVLVGAVSFANIFMSWDELTDVQKAESILTVIDACFAMTKNFIMWKSVNTIFNPEATPQERLNAFYRYQVGGGQMDILESVTLDSGEGFNLKNEVEENATRYSRKMNGDKMYSSVTLDRTSKVFVLGEIVFKILNVVLLGIAFVASVMELKKMYSNKSGYELWVRALSVANGVITGLSLVLGITEFALSFSAGLSSCFFVASFIPVANAVLMGLMLIISIVMLVGGKKPKAPITQLIEEKIRPFIDALPEPSQTWIDKNTAPASA